MITRELPPTPCSYRPPQVWIGILADPRILHKKRATNTRILVGRIEMRNEEGLSRALLIDKRS